MSTYKERREQREQRRRMGLNIMSLVSAARSLGKDALTGDVEHDAAIILEQFICQNKDAVAAEMSNVGINWDIILEWIEKLMPIILLIISFL